MKYCRGVFARRFRLQASERETHVRTPVEDYVRDSGLSALLRATPGANAERR